MKLQPASKKLAKVRAKIKALREEMQAADVFTLDMETYDNRMHRAAAIRNETRDIATAEKLGY
jgi:hypothetical protein